MIKRVEPPASTSKPSDDERLIEYFAGSAEFTEVAAAATKGCLGQRRRFGLAAAETPFLLNLACAHPDFCEMMPTIIEFFRTTTLPAYSSKAQPYLDAIAESVFSSEKVRDWLIKGTPVEAEYLGAHVLFDEQRRVRWQKSQTKQPFWANYWCGKDSSCTCRIEGSKGLESDAIFFLRNRSQRVLAVHAEFKHANEAFGYGQPEAYPLRADCFAKTYHTRPTMNPHHDWATVIFCGEDSLSDERISNFQRVITHNEAAAMISGYPR